MLESCLAFQDQNEYQTSNEIEVLKGIISTVNEMMVTTSHVVVGDLAGRVARRTPFIVQRSFLLSLAKYYLMHLDDDSKYLAEELIYFHSKTVNPEDLVISSQFWHTLAVEPGFRSKPLVRHYLTLSQYTNAKELLQGLQPMPPTSTIVTHCDGL